MKKLILISAFALFAAVSNAAENPKEEVAAPAIEKVDYKDAFLGLVLEKANKYSDAFESGLGKAIESTQTIVSKAVDTASEEAPKLMHEFLIWRFAENVLKFSWVLILFVFSAYTAYKYFPKWIDSFHTNTVYTSKTTEEDTKQVKYGVTGWVSLLASIILGIILLNNTDRIMTAVQIKVAPRVYIIEQAIEIYKDSKTPTRR